MITNIRLQNYKAFQDVSIDIKPITILLGANSVGKSSVIQFFSLLKQTAANTLINEPSPLKTCGYYANMGLVDNLFHNKDTGSPFSFSISFVSKTLNRDLRHTFDEYVGAVTRLGYFLPIKGLLKWRKEFIQSDDRAKFHQFVSDLISSLPKENLDRYRENLNYAISQNSLLRIDDLETGGVHELMAVYDFLNTLQKDAKPKGCQFTVTYQLSYKSSGLHITMIQILVSSKKIIEILIDNDYIEVISEMAEINERTRSGVTNNFHSYDNIFECINTQTNDGKNEVISTTMSNYLSSVAMDILNDLRKEFSSYSVNHMGPLRAFPQRYYLLDQEAYALSPDFSKGESIVQALKNSKPLTSKVNKWLEIFGFDINVERSEEVIHHLKVSQNKLDLNILDVGFGISQILPILVQCFFAKEDTLTTIEQPEIHLHPQMQAQLANLFVEVSTEKNRNLVIETHSEYMLRRLRLLVADPKHKEVGANDVGIYFFEGKDISNGKDYVTVRELPMSKTGKFEWPEEFYKTDMEDNIAFLQLQ
jgi:hypothetical protein